MAQTGLLVITSPLGKGLQSQMGRILQAAREHVRKTLYVQLLPGIRSGNLVASSSTLETLPPAPAPAQPGARMAQYSIAVSGLYSKASVICRHLDVRVLLGHGKRPEAVGRGPATKHSIDVVIFDRVLKSREMQEFVESKIVSHSEHCKVLTLDFDPMAKPSKDEGEDVSEGSRERVADKMYRYTALGGTFDRLHNGHKILLSEGVLRTSEEMLVGVTDGPMLMGKKVHELIEPCLVRMQHVRDFLEDIDPTLEYRIVPLLDTYGPTKDDPKYEMMVVSEETHRGGLKCNEVRNAGGLPPLEFHQIPLLEDKFRTSVQEEEKLSSSSLRMRLLGTRWQEPESTPHLPNIPYVIGLTGGICSGKSLIAKKLETLGAACINCDQLGHLAYLKDTECFNKIVGEFGEDVKDAQGEVDRKRLGSKVFGNKERMAALNRIVWPEIAAQVQAEVVKAREEKKLVVIVEAAVLLEAGWDKLCHEVWTSFIPKKEAIRRLQERNALSEKEAESRISSQMSNEERISRSNIVFSTFWAPEFTHQQVERAWEVLKGVLARFNCSL